MKIDLIRDISILLAEDEEELRESTVEYLQMFFSRVYSAACGKEAYEIYKEKRPNIILTDINMPNLDGLSLISNIREKDKETKVIIMSAHSDQEKLLHAVKLHLETYLIKPIKSDVLKKVLFDTVEQIRVTNRRIYFSDNIYWDSDTYTFWENNAEIQLRKKETLLLKLLCSKPNHNFTSEDIFNYLHQSASENEFSNDAVTSLVKRTRSKLPKDTIKTVYGSGYKIVPI
ncbi:response regulator [Candidatus Sulfurimonas marisnigri]|uniref:Response regulator n=1 Tax=Candidatus Sulfurimonas marisnigri TaxID=2740405 RepID=A0A7S7M1I8_9BACT|nr:response regulator [Candidatus Sulfurimonas marisnigri]QOY54828.1 response regulator [Candidatus Sulfurimonas marisnigri]